MKPKPPITLVVCSVAIIGVCTLLISISLTAFIAAWDPMAILGSLVITPLAVLLGQCQYRGTFRNTANAARSSANFLFFAGGFVFFLLSSVVIESLYELKRMPPLSFIVPTLVVGLAGCYAGWLNLSWSRRLKMVSATTECSAIPTGFSLRELFFGVSAVAILTAMTTFFVKTIPPQYAEHVSRDEAPGNLPQGARDISFSQGGRGTIAYEFTIDETGFIEWVNSGIGSLESEAANISLKTITIPYEIRRYGAFAGNTTAPESIIVTNGLYYDWSKEDRGVHAAFDRTTKRAYYSAHFQKNKGNFLPMKDNHCLRMAYMKKIIEDIRTIVLCNIRTFTLVAMAPATFSYAAETKVPVTFTGGHELSKNDYGRPIALMAAGLGVKPEEFRKAFSGVTPARGRGPTGAEARSNKAALMKVLAPLKVTNERMDEVANYYRFRPQNGEMWPTKAAEAYAVVEDGKIKNFVVTEPGSGYNSPPKATVKGFEKIRLETKVKYDKDLKKNGGIAAVDVAPKEDAAKKL